MKCYLNFLLPVLVLTIITATGCSAPDNTAELWTNIPEITTYADQFNSQQDIYRIKIVYKENPGSALLAEGLTPDIVVSNNLNSIRYESLLEDLTQLLDPEKGTINRELFYPDLLLAGSNGQGQQYTFPVSFNLPALYYKTGTSMLEEREELWTQDDVKTAADLFSEEGEKAFPSRGFSPLWSGNYMYALAQVRGTGFRETSKGVPSWNSEKITETLNEIKAWNPVAPQDSQTGTPMGSFEDEIAFEEKYLYEPRFKSVNSGRIYYSYTTVRDFQQIPTLERKTLKLHWVSDGNSVPACSDILFTGILKKGEDKESAEAFLSWFFRLDTQRELLESSQFKRIREFGIARGFSSLYLVNELDFPRYYPVLIGIIPSQREILFPRILPAEWEKIRSEVVIPWMMREVRYQQEEYSLEESIQNWYNRQP